MNPPPKSGEANEAVGENSRHSRTKKVTFIRHGRTHANEYLSGDGTSWGSPNFRDPPQLKDSSLTAVGRMQAEREVSILERFGACWNVLMPVRTCWGVFGACWSVLGLVRACWSVLGVFGACWSVLERIGACWGVLGRIGACLSVLYV
jgi:hypothetical protein